MAGPIQMISRQRIQILGVLALFLLGIGAAPACRAEEPQPVSFKATDGVQLHGYLFGKGSTGVILAHMYPADQKSWFPFAEKLAAKGYLAMTFDFRGYGESGGEKVISEIDRDLEGAYRFLQPKVKKIFLIGASMGGTAAIRIASENPTAGVITLSAPMAFQGLDARQAIRKLKVPCLFIAAQGDSYAFTAAREFNEAADSPKRDILIVPGSQHGTRLFEGPDGREIEKAIFQFLEKY